MNGYGFERDELESANEAWRPLDRALLRWVLAHGGSRALAVAAAEASLADGRGDTALELREAAPGNAGRGWTREQVDALRAEPMVATGDAADPVPFVLDHADRFYLRRNFRDESAVVAHVLARRARDTPPEAGALDAASLDALFGGRDDAAVAQQRAAVCAVAGRRLFVLTGGPGTGKTATVLRMLLALQHVAGRALSIRLAAPTGKAAQRLAQALREGRQALAGNPAAPLPAAWRPLLDAIPGDDATTLHRLLEYRPWDGRFGRDAAHPLAADVVVVDEASMIDLAMLRTLLDALPAAASLVLVGDADQLASIGVGSVLMDLVEAFEAGGGGEVVRLRHGFRSERSLAAVLEAVRRGDAPAFADAARDAGERFVERDVADPRRLAQALAAWALPLAQADLRPVVSADDPSHADRVRAALRALAGHQLLCALREGAFGALAADAAIVRALRRAWGVTDPSPWFAGRAVMVTRNDHLQGLSNGDVGLCLADAQGALHVWFEGIDAQGHAGLRRFAPSALPPHEGAFAVTIHKSQGSEYDRVAVLLPPDAGNPVLSRQLLYTGLSRARQAVELWGSRDVVAAALARKVRRVGGLAERLRGLDGASTR